MKEQLYKMINGIEPSIILAFSVFYDNAVPMYGNYRKKQNSHPFLKVCLQILWRYAFSTHKNFNMGGMILESAK